MGQGVLEKSDCPVLINPEYSEGTGNSVDDLISNATETANGAGIEEFQELLNQIAASLYTT